MEPSRLREKPHLFVEILESLSGLANAEARLAQTKLLNRLGLTSRMIILGLNIFCVTLLGMGALLAGAVMWLGERLGGRPWLAAFLLGGALLLLALPLAVWKFNKEKDA